MVAVACPRPFDEAIVEVVEDRRRENAIEPEDAGSSRRTRTCCGCRAGSRRRSRRRRETVAACSRGTLRRAAGARRPATPASMTPLAAHQRIVSARVSRNGRYVSPSSAVERVVSTVRALSRRKSSRPDSGSGPSRPPARSLRRAIARIAGAGRKSRRGRRPVISSRSAAVSRWTAHARRQAEPRPGPCVEREDDGACHLPDVDPRRPAVRDGAAAQQWPAAVGRSARSAASSGPTIVPGMQGDPGQPRGLDLAPDELGLDLASKIRIGPTLPARRRQRRVLVDAGGPSAKTTSELMSTTRPTPAAPAASRTVRASAALRRHRRRVARGRIGMWRRGGRRRPSPCAAGPTTRDRPDRPR